MASCLSVPNNPADIALDLQAMWRSFPKFQWLVIYVMQGYAWYLRKFKRAICLKLHPCRISLFPVYTGVHRQTSSAAWIRRSLDMVSIWLIAAIYRSIRRPACERALLRASRTVALLGRGRTRATAISMAAHSSKPLSLSSSLRECHDRLGDHFLLD